MDYYEERDCYPEIDGTEVKIDLEKSEIRRFYTGINIFITGGAGFIGGLLIEKIARSCPDFGKIYLLLRPKRGHKPSERLKLIFQDEVFDRLKKENPGFISKLHLVEGDLGEPMCGLSEENQQILRDEVDVVFHIASCLRMAEPLKTAYDMNVRATKDLLDFATSMVKLKGFVYVSTAYSHAFRQDISENFYEVPYKWEDLKNLATVGSEEQITSLSPKLVGPWLNTYAFTKAVVEDTIKTYVGRIPVAIARPSIVIGCNEEPLTNWINNIYGVTGATAGACVGLMRVWYGDPDVVADIIPADFVVNTIIAIPWQIWRRFENREHLAAPIYNIVSSPKAPTTWGEYTTLSAKGAIDSKVTTKKVIGMYAFTLVKYWWLFFLLTYLFHLGQGLIIDAFLILRGKQPKLLKGYVKIMRFNLQLGFYGNGEWKYEQPNVDKLLEEMNDEDKKLFPFDMTNFNWHKYHLTTVRAIYRYIIKAYDDVEDPTEALRRYYRVFGIMKYILLPIKLYLLYLLFGLTVKVMLKMYAYL